MTIADRERAPFWRALVGALLPNVAFVLAGHYVAMPRGAVNVDYIVLAAAWPWLSGALFIGGASLLLTVDVLESMAGSYYFSFTDAISCITDVVNLSPVFAIGIGIVALLLIAAIAWTSGRLLSRSMTRQRAAVLLTIACVIAMVDLADGTNMFSRRQDTRVHFNLAGSAVLRATGQVARYVAELRHPAGSASVTGATASLLHDAASQARRENVVLIVEESFGLMLDEQGRNLLRAPFLSAGVVEKYDVEEREIAFHGSTVAGEFRELCGREVGLRARASNGTDLDACLPALFHRAGYHTTALHGFTSRMFERDRWYPRFRFDERLFEGELRGLGLKECGFAFRGICDSAIASNIADRLASASTPQFIYWLTLNAHLPVDHSLAEDSSFDCNRYGPARENPDVCDWMRVTISTNEAIARLASDPRLPPTRFIIVGDHAPPFLAQAKRELFSQSRVPAIDLQPRSRPPQLLSRNEARHR